MIHHFIFNNNNNINTNSSKKAGRFCSRDAPLYSYVSFLFIFIVFLLFTHMPYANRRQWWLMAHTENYNFRMGQTKGGEYICTNQCI